MRDERRPLEIGRIGADFKPAQAAEVKSLGG
jgi:hypothetical protein